MSAGTEVSAVLLIKPMTLPRTTSGKVPPGTRTQYLAGTLVSSLEPVRAGGVNLRSSCPA
jgi:hypothetical protein